MLSLQNLTLLNVLLKKKKKWGLEDRARSSGENELLVKRILNDAQVEFAGVCSIHNHH